MYELTPVIAIHMTAAIVATIIGPLALWARLGMTKRPKLHRAFGYAWVTMMLVTAMSAIFIPSYFGFSWRGFSPIHLLIPLTLCTLFMAFRSLIKGNIRAHKIYMMSLYVNACLGAGFFTLMPGRYLGTLLWK